jgi:hypothetical protein
MKNAGSFTLSRMALCLVLLFVSLGLAACQIRPIGLIYTNIRLPLTTDLHNTPVPDLKPGSGQTVEVKEPISGYGFYARVSSRAIGDIARKNGMHRLYFADQQIFSILGIYTSHRTILHGE